MIPHPIAATLWICQQVIIDKDTNNPSLIGVFTGLAVEKFPSPPQRLSVFAALTDGLGKGRIALEVTSLELDERTFVQYETIEFPERLRVVNLSFRLTQVRFPRPGLYAFTLSVDDAWVAERTLRVYGVT